ncbi:MAG: hypothetical protein ACT6S0_08485 [Roseateles sp.]|uniref:hypothetical protein n=1 Tax=Roseateles sp. TaxID=1971397 RepID=UPI00403549E9
MSSRPRTPADRQAALSEKQIEAYLAARDVLRRIRRTHSLVAPLLARRSTPASPHPGQAGG